MKTLSGKFVVFALCVLTIGVFAGRAQIVNQLDFKMAQPFTVGNTTLAWKIHDFISTKGLAMVQIRCLGRFETKSEAFACPNIPQQTVSFFQIFLIDRWSRDLINDRAVPMVEQFFSRLPSGALA